MSPQTYRNLQAETSKGVNVWSRSSSVVASIDFLKAGARVDESLAAFWDLIIIDEIQDCSAMSQRGEVAKRIWSDPIVPLAVAATAVPDTPDWLVKEINTQRIHWNSADIGQYLKVPKRNVRVINYTLSKIEKDISARTAQIIHSLPKTSQSEFMGQILWRRLSSCMYALEQSMRSLLANRYLDQINEEQGRDLEVIPTSLTSRDTGMMRDDLERIISVLETQSEDSKWASCERLLRNHGIGETCSGAIFTDFAHTAQYLEYVATNRGLTTFSITGSSSVDQRHLALQSAKSSPSILIVTTGAAEGLSLAYTNQIVHYDLPWDPMALLQRYGRVERLGSQFEEVFHYHLVAEESPTEAILQSVLQKLQSLEQAFG
jgi:SNF2 family DNA or RNA helicase